MSDPVLDITAAVRSEPGQRDSNEDRVLVCREGPRWLAVLADGAGGHARGAEAARLAVECLEAKLHGDGAPFTAEALSAAVLAAHAEVSRAQTARSGGRDRMHTTVVVLWVDSGRQQALWSHVGDSRLYLVRHGHAERLTADDSVVQRMLDAGLLTPLQAQAHPQKNQLIAALGIDDALEPHTVAQPLPLEDGDAFLLCSDGWWGSLDDDAAISLTAGEAATPHEWLGAMQSRIERQSVPRQDNFSAIAVWAGDFDEATRPMGSLFP